MLNPADNQSIPPIPAPESGGGFPLPLSAVLFSGGSVERRHCHIADSLPPGTVAAIRQAWRRYILPYPVLRPNVRECSALDDEMYDCGLALVDIPLPEPGLRLSVVYFLHMLPRPHWNALSIVYKETARTPEMVRRLSALTATDWLRMRDALAALPQIERMPPAPAAADMPAWDGGGCLYYHFPLGGRLVSRHAASPAELSSPVTAACIVPSHPPRVGFIRRIMRKLWRVTFGER